MLSMIGAREVDERGKRNHQKASISPISNRYGLRIEIPVTYRKQSTGNFLPVTQNAKLSTPSARQKSIGCSPKSVQTSLYG
jgi:hypothetical protein